MEPLVQANRLTKTYGKLNALHECNLTIPRGCVFGLLGPNGAGKTTLIRTLMGFLRPTSGSASIDSLDCTSRSVEVRRRVSYLPAEAKLFRGMRGRAVIEFFAKMHPYGSLDLARKLAERLALPLSHRVAFMSTGMRQKLAVVCVLSCQTPLVILDEPTANLDPTIRAEILNLIMEAKNSGRTVLFSSHVLSEVEEVCDHAAIMRSGSVVCQVDITDLLDCHRVRFSLSQPPETVAEKFNVGSMPHGVDLVSSERGTIVLDIKGSLENHLLWLAEFHPRQLRIEPAGLRAIYERFHSEPSKLNSPIAT